MLSALLWRLMPPRTRLLSTFASERCCCASCCLRGSWGGQVRVLSLGHWRPLALCHGDHHQLVQASSRRTTRICDRDTVTDGGGISKCAAEGSDVLRVRQEQETKQDPGPGRSGILHPAACTQTRCPSVSVGDHVLYMRATRPPCHHHREAAAARPRTAYPRALPLAGAISAS